MTQFLADENFNNQIVRGILRQSVKYLKQKVPLRHW